MTSFNSMTSDELRREIARGNFPPIAGADDGTVEEAPEAADLSGIIGEAVGTQEPEQEPLLIEETPEAPEAETAEETPEEPAEEPVDPAEQLEQYNLALDIALDPENEQYDTAVEILRELAPESVLAAYGLTGDAEEMPDFAEEPDEDDPYGLGDDATGVPEIDKALGQIKEFNRQQEEGQTKAQQEAEAAAEEAAAKAFAEDFKELSGADLPKDISSMNDEQRLLATALIGADGIEGVDDPKTFVKEALEARDKAKIQAAIDEYAKGKGEYKPTPITERSASTNAGNIHTPSEAISTIEGLIREAATPANGVSG